MKKFLIGILFLLPLLTVSCKENKQDEPKSEVLAGIVKNLFGKWLLSSSDAKNWIVYEFTETSRLNVKMEQEGKEFSGSGFYSVDENRATVTGSYSSGLNDIFYIDWIAKKSFPFQVDFEQYDGQMFVGQASIYRIVADLEITAESSIIPKYRDFTGQNTNSGFTALDDEIVSVDEASGEITGHREGSTFVTFDTKDGKAVVRVSVSKVKTLAEIIVGTWIYDYPKEHEWQKTTFFNDGKMAVEWGLDNIEEIAGSGTGNYEVTQDNIKFTVNSAGTKILQEWRIISFDEYDCSYDCYSGSYFAGEYTCHKLLDSYIMHSYDSVTPDYTSFLGNALIKGYTSHNDAVATVNSTGEITARSIGRTYIEIHTNNGSGVVEVVVR